MTGVGTPVEHLCETDHHMFGDFVLHVVLTPHHLCSTPLRDLRDAGYAIVAVGVLPDELPECPAAEGYVGCEHVLIATS